MKPERSIRRIIPLLLAAALPSLSGCIGFLPKPSYNPAFGRKLTPAMVEFIRVHQTTRAEVVARLGPNYSSLPMERALAYPWGSAGLSYEWYFVALGPYGGGAEKLDWKFGPAGGCWRAFLVAFDERGVVQAIGFKSLAQGKSLHEHLDDWVASLGWGLPQPRDDALLAPGRRPNAR